MRKIFLLFIVAMTVAFFSCKKGDTDNKAAAIQLTGLLKQQGFTIYQYGTHILITSSAGYALKSTVLDLNQYVNRTVTITGNTIPGYPIEAGPPYIDVQTIQQH